MTVLQELTKIVSGAFAECGYDGNLGEVSVSDRIDLCQFQCNGAFAGAKLYKKPPFAIAEEIAQILRKNDIFQSVEMVKPGFINIILTDKYIIENVNKIANDVHLGIPQDENGETIVLDYGGPNVAKPLHVGHLRSAIIGESLKRIAVSTGRKVISDIHLGDWGLQIGLVIAELEERNPEWKCFSPDFNPDADKIPSLSADELNELYPSASEKSKKDEAFKNKARVITAMLQKGHAGYISVWKEIMRVSVPDLKESYDKLRVSFDYWYGESDAEKYIGELMEILTRKEMLYESEGAMVADVSEETDKVTIPPVIIKKSDNSNIYATTDLATIIQRMKDFSPDKMWYVVDKRQELHLTQVFRCSKKAGIVPSLTELEYLGFGTMNGSDGKPYKTRDGGVMRLSEFLSAITSAAYEKISQSSLIPDSEKEDTAEKIAVAAIKFGDLSNHRTKDYIFDIDKFLSFEGKTGTYLIYTVTRINSILKKLNLTPSQSFAFTDIYTPSERALYLTVILTSESFKSAIKEKAPNFICDNAYKLASQFSTFYHDNQILPEQNNAKKSSWISLSRLTKKLLETHLSVLGIPTVERM